MHLRQLIYCFVLVGILGVVAKTASANGRDWWQRFVRALSALARHKTLSWIGLGVLVLVVRAALLPIWPIPAPTIYDEFSYLIEVWWRGGGDWRIHRLFSRGGLGHSSPDRGDESST
jgi:hypothetical protein